MAKSKKPMFQGLKAQFEAEENQPQQIKPEAPATPPPSNRRPCRIGKKILAGYYSPELIKELKKIALEEDTTAQALLGEAIDLLFRDRGKHPMNER